jgi:hypothetical protein
MRRELLLIALLGAAEPSFAQEQPEPPQMALETRIEEDNTPEPNTEIASAPDENHKNQHGQIAITEEITTINYDVNVRGVKLIGVPLPQLTPARSTWTMQQVNRDFESEEFPKLTENLDTILNGFTEETQLFHVTYKTKLRTAYSIASRIGRHLVNLADGVDYQYSEEILIKTDRGYRPIIGIHKLRKDGKEELLCEIFYRGLSEYERIDLDTGEHKVERRDVPANIMQDTHSALTLRIALAELRLRGAPHEVDMGHVWGKDEYFPVELVFAPYGSRGIATCILENYLGINATTSLIVPYRRAENVFTSGLDKPIKFRIGNVTATFKER